MGDAHLHGHGIMVFALCVVPSRHPPLKEEFTTFLLSQWVA